MNPEDYVAHSIEVLNRNKANKERVTITKKGNNMREIHDHKSGIAGDASDNIKVFAMDAPGQGNACHEYSITLADPVGPEVVKPVTEVSFQNGPLKENSFNGCSNESILAIVIDRLKGFQDGPYACRENALALTKIQEAVMWLHQRTKDRAARSVEGYNLK